MLWTDAGNMLGWDFRYTEREGGASFRYEYLAPEQADQWTVRIRSRDGTADLEMARPNGSKPNLEF